MINNEERFCYCVKCMSCQDFILVNSIYVCKECKTPMQKANGKRTNVPLTLSSNDDRIATSGGNR
jgi:hypothetical protein